MKSSRLQYMTQHCSVVFLRYALHNINTNKVMQKLHIGYIFIESSSLGVDSLSRREWFVCWCFASGEHGGGWGQSNREALWCVLMLLPPHIKLLSPSTGSYCSHPTGKPQKPDWNELYTRICIEAHIFPVTVKADTVCSVPNAQLPQIWMWLVFIFWRS